MLKEQKRNLKKVSVLAKCDFSTIYRLEDGRLYKEFHPYVMQIYKVADISLEGKILEGDRFAKHKGFYQPLSAVYNGNEIAGYTMAFNPGYEFTTYEDKIGADITDLYYYANNYSKLTQLVKEGHELKAIFPDLCTTENIYVSKDGEFSLTDYDGFQVGNYGVVSMSTSLDLKPEEFFYQPKFCEKIGLFTEELDKYSLLVLYFLDVFNIRINAAGYFNPRSGIKITLAEIAYSIGLNDIEIIRMVSDTLSSDKEGVYVNEIANRMADLYLMKAVPRDDGGYMKQLIKK